MKIPLEKRDFNRAILTDVLPYEVPFILTNEGFYKNLKSNASLRENRFLKSIFFSGEEVDTKPLVYRITKDSDSERSLYLIHPSVQIKICSLYKNYNQLITHLCTRSSFSLRYPSKIAHSYYSKEKKVMRNLTRNLKMKELALMAIMNLFMQAHFTNIEM